MKFLNKFLYAILIFVVCVILFWQFFLKGLIPLASDTIIGMYHPWRDLYARNYPNGIPYNNPLITDPVRQQFVWKKLVMDSYKIGKLPIENPYSFSGYPLLANFQSGAFYPLNILFFVLPFNIGWGVYIFLQFFLGGIFMFWFLRNMLRNSEGVKTTEESHSEQIAFLGSVVWILSGFWIAWAEWGNILHTALWLPLILLSLDRIIKNKNIKLWGVIYSFSLISSFFAGHLQTFFYLYVFSIFYFFYQLRTTNYVLRTFRILLILNSIFLILSAIQWYPTLQFILQSARSYDVANVLAREDWFIPFKHLIQLFIPDYFGNPAKGNYFGVWNYGEYLSYIGIIPIFLAIFGIIKSAVNRKNIFWLIGLSVVLLLVTKNPISEIPYRLAVPFFSTAQPSRLIFLFDFFLVIFSAKFLMNRFDDSNHRSKLISGIIFSVFLFIIVSSSLLDKTHSSVILRNSIQPVVIFTIFTLISLIPPISLFRRKLFLPILFLLIFFDQSRVFWRFNTFADQKYIFPETKITKFLEDDLKNGFFRISSLDARIMPPNFSAFYKIPSIDGYDPLYFENYAKIISNGGSINFNRIIQLSGPSSGIYDELKVKYVLTFNDLPEKEYRLVMTEGKTKLYKYLNF